jgi:glycosyltransferase involved in cell wall biosynthesis
MIRVGFICDTFDLGGLELSCLEVVGHLDRTRFQPYLFTFRPGSLVSQAKALGIPISVGHSKPGSDTVWTEQDELARQSYIKRLSKELTDCAIDVCVIYGWRDGIKAARDAGINALVERLDGPCLINRISDKSSFYKIICESKTARDVVLAQRYLLRCRRQQLTVIPNGIDLCRFNPDAYDKVASRKVLGLGSDDFVVCCVARLAPEKNLGQLLEAVRYLVDSEQKATATDQRPTQIVALLVGPDGGCEEQLKDQARRLGIATHIRFLGPRGDIPEILCAADAFALTSLIEGVSFAVLEAMAMGLPIVATQVGGLTETIDGNGFLVGVLRPEQTYKALWTLRHDYRLSWRLSRRGRQLAKRYDFGKMILSYEEVIAETYARSLNAPRKRA